MSFEPAGALKGKVGRRVEFQIHAALVEVLNVGVLLRGDSGVGKSECALELVQRGHGLVADDVVLLRTHGEGEPAPELRGRAPDLIRHYMELRGIGLLNISDLYGPESVRNESRVELICQLEAWRDGFDYERIGLDRPIEEVLGVPLPALTLPVRPARSMATLVEVAVRDLLRRKMGINAARRLDDRLREKTRESAHGIAGEGP